MADLIKQQYSLGKTIGRIVNYLQQLGEETVSEGVVEARLSLAKETWEKFRSNHLELLGSVREDDKYIKNDYFATVEVQYLEALSKLLTLKSSYAQLSPPNADASTPTNRMNEGTPSVFHSSVQTPRISLPSFSGAYSEWESFFDQFRTSIHDRPDIPKVYKLNFLKQCLTGDAASSLKNVAVTEANYDKAWTDLQNRYTNKRMLLHAQMCALSDLPAMTKESAVEMRRLLDRTLEAVRAMENLGRPVEKWGDWLVFQTLRRLDVNTRKAWETHLGPTMDLPSFEQLQGFLECRIRALEMVASRDLPSEHKVISQGRLPSKARSHHVSAREGRNRLSKTCALCKGDHFVFSCDSFRKKSISERLADIERLKLCRNCLGSHFLKDCASQKRCSECNGRHNTLLHQAKSQPTAMVSEPSTSTDVTSSVTTLHSVPLREGVSGRRSVLLATVRARLSSPSGNHVTIRALLDPGSEASFLSESIAQLLGLHRHSVSVPLHGVGAVHHSTSKGAVQCTLNSNFEHQFQINVWAYVLQKLTGRLPAARASVPDHVLPDGCLLADPDCLNPGHIDAIFGAEVYGHLLRDGFQRLTPDGLIAQRTALGWVLTGQAATRRAGIDTAFPVGAYHCATNSDLHEVLQKFWGAESVPENRHMLSPEEAFCEEHFARTHTRTPSGRYVVRLPIREEYPEIGKDTRKSAVTRLYSMERRFSRDPDLQKRYIQFMGEYMSMQHMTPVTGTGKPDSGVSWYLPHHAVIQRFGSQTKLRVVFDASHRDSQARSLNDILLPGPSLQGDLILLLIRWRSYRFVFTTDIVKMFRQIIVHEDDRYLQRIVWREKPLNPIEDFELSTGTYGTSSAPFLAIRTLHQLAADEQSRYPIASRCLIDEMYVDDVLTGADDLQSALEKQLQLIGILREGGFPLDKWASNHQDLLPEPGLYQGTNHRSFDPHGLVKTLGLIWYPAADQFSYRYSPTPFPSDPPTKRIVLSSIARIFDPLGLITAVVITAKILLQDLWLSRTEWDEPLPSKLHTRWVEYAESLTGIEDIRIARWVGASYPATSLELHGFADASSRAYAACIYLKSIQPNGKSRIDLIIAKSKVAPVKTLSIPKLELLAAALLVTLITQLRRIPTYANLQVRAWSDSQVVLAWLRQHPSRWKPFVANRVAFIQTSETNATWRYVPSLDNPADVATRGISPRELQDSSLWWNGPFWLAGDAEFWPNPRQGDSFEEAEMEARTSITMLHARVDDYFSEVISRYSSLTRLIRVFAYIFRFLYNCRSSLRCRRYSFLSTDELKAAESKLLIVSQGYRFSNEIQLLRKCKPLPRHSSILPLNPFLDTQGILRVGGRLRNASLTFREKHPPILAKDDPLTPLYVDFAHKATLHGGPSLTFTFLQRTVWILRGKVLVKAHFRRCIRCFRSRPIVGSQIMGDLPDYRTRPARPFSRAGLDFAGPIRYRTAGGRGNRSQKGYIALFVCLATRAIHVELVGDLSTKAFLAAYRRFAGRRGVAACLYSDNATNFRGADSELRYLFREASKSFKEVATALAQDGTEWRFIPPSAPPFGGIWEAGIKSVKTHLRKVIGDQTLTFEELTTVLIQIESCLNSRPLLPMTSDPDDLSVLTPAHFLIGSALFTVPEPEITGSASKVRSRWQLIQRIHQDFWKSWSRSYLQHLQGRAKWRTAMDNFAVGQLVLCRDERYPPTKWPLGRVVATHPGADGLVRVVTIKTSSSCMKRPVARLCPLPITSEA